MHCVKVPVEQEHSYDTTLEQDSKFLTIVEELRSWKEHHKK